MMNWRSALGVPSMPALLLLLLCAPGAFAQELRCNMTSPCGAAPAPACAGGCAPSAPVYHASALPCSAGNGSFNLIGTHYETTCSCAPSCVVDLPPVRFWQYDAYAAANNGCQRQDNCVAGVEWMVNATPGNTGHWYLWQPNWAGPDVDGCYTTAVPRPAYRTVVEVASVDRRPGFEGTFNHGSWYVLASVPLTVGFNFDTITGGTGCTPAEVVKQPVRGVTVVGLGGPCTGSGVSMQSMLPDIDPGYFDVQVTLDDPGPHWWNETGQDGAPQLIAGYQILYTTGPEPTTSDYVTGNWRPVHDPVNAPLALGLVPLGNGSPITVALPITDPLTDYWLATRIVYRDASENPVGTFDPALGTPSNPVGPQIASPVSGHCGAVHFGIRLQIAPVAALGLARQGDDIRLSWQGPPSAIGYNAWTVTRKVDIDNARITRRPPAVGVVGCSFPTPATGLSCLDAGAVSRGTPGLLFYQVRVANDSRSEGP